MSFGFTEEEHNRLIDQVYEKMVLDKLSLKKAASMIGITGHTLEAFINKRKSVQFRTVMLIKTWLE